MTDGTPGWYLDRDDSALARWHDGTEWTEHTLVIAEQDPGGDPPPPPAARRLSDAALQRERVAAAEERRAAREAAAAQRSGYPRWVPVAVAAVVGLLAAGAFAVLGGDDDGDTTVDTEETASIEEAVEAARDAGFPDQISDARLSGLIEDLCEAADRPARTATLNAQLESLPLEPAVLPGAIRALGSGAEVYCPSSEDGIETALGQLQNQTGTDPGGVTDTTLPSVDGGVVDGSVTTIAGSGDSTATTRKPTTGTTKKPTTATTAAPPTTAATTTVPPTTTTTIPKVSPVQKSCSTEGAKAIQGSAPVTCKQKCGSGPLVWVKDGTQCQAPPGSTPVN